MKYRTENFTVWEGIDPNFVPGDTYKISITPQGRIITECITTDGRICRFRCPKDHAVLVWALRELGAEKMKAQGITFEKQMELGLSE